MQHFQRLSEHPWPTWLVVSRGERERRAEGAQHSYPCTCSGSKADFFSSELLSQHAGTSWEASWPHMNPVEVTRVRVTARELDDAKTYGPHAEL